MTKDIDGYAFWIPESMIYEKCRSCDGRGFSEDYLGENCGDCETYARLDGQVTFVLIKLQQTGKYHNAIDLTPVAAVSSLNELKKLNDSIQGL